MDVWEKNNQAQKFGVIDEKYEVVLSELKEVVLSLIWDWCGAPCHRTLGLPRA